MPQQPTTPTLHITLDGQTLPCRQTMGAFLHFRRETGREATELTGELTDMLTFFYCCVRSACRADGIPFDLTLEQFADRITPTDLNSWTEQMQAAAANDEATHGDEATKKKSPSAS